MKIITSGSTYIDVDAYACIIAYAELLRNQHIEATAISTAILNESVSMTLRSWPASIETRYIPSPDDTFTLIDVSDPGHFDKIVDVAKVEKVIDHHPGFEDFWHTRINGNAHIEFIGAACTLVYEYWKTAGLLNEMSGTSARLLASGILDNTLNFGANITTQRDIDAYNTLSAHANLPSDWAAQYFKECQEAILSNPVVAAQNDTKTLKFKSFTQPVSFGQMAIWDGKHVVAHYENALKNAYKTIGSEWLINVISLSDQKSYFITDSPNAQEWLSKLLYIEFNGSVAIATRPWLRKEILQEDIASHSGMI